MTLEQIFFTSQTNAALATIGALVFVGLEMRNSTRESRHRAIEQMLQNYRAVRSEIASNADLARIWIGGLGGVVALDLVDRARFLLTAMDFFSTHESLFLHCRDGRLSRELYEPQAKNLSDVLTYRGMHISWDCRRNYFHNEFRTMVDEQIAVMRKSGTAPSLYGEESA
jgi:hypothetical protein